MGRKHKKEGPPERRGFSLIELLIVMAIIATLIGTVAFTFFDYLQQAKTTKVRADLDVLVQAIHRHDQFNLDIGGGNLNPLLGRYLHSLPEDPWGNPYVFDGNLGVLGSFGADGIEGGGDEHADLIRYYKSPLTIIRAQYTGSWRG